MINPGLVLAALPAVPSSNRHQATVAPDVPKTHAEKVIQIAKASALGEGLLRFIAHFNFLSFLRNAPAGWAVRRRGPEVETLRLRLSPATTPRVAFFHSSRFAEAKGLA